MWDDVDGNLTAGTSSFGAAAVDTSAPTPPTQPYLITYSAADAAGNLAVFKQRRVAAVCPPSEAICNSSSALAVAAVGKPYCSTHGMCLGPPAAVTAAAAATAAGPPLPQLQLVGPSSVALPLGAAYAACPANPPADAACDRWGPWVESGGCWAVSEQTLRVPPSPPCPRHSCCACFHANIADGAARHPSHCPLQGGHCLADTGWEPHPVHRGLQQQSSGGPPAAIPVCCFRCWGFV